MKLCRVGNQTNSPDPIAVNSRVFVGNLNTFQCSKAELERMFQRYGRIAGISMHKGYAFVQFANAFDARSACLGEDKRVVLGQTLDVNLVSEPKAHQTGRKRQNITKTGNDWDYYYDSYYASVGLSAGPPPPQRLAGPPGPPHKRARLMVPLSRGVPSAGPPGPGSPGLKHAHAPALNGHLLNGGPPLVAGVPPGLPPGLPHLQPHAPGPGHGPGHGHAPAPASPPLNGHHPATINVFSNPDILICGNCREMYTDLQELLSHKKAHCKLRFACKCHTLPEGKSNHEATLLCSSCRASFSSAWDLMVHVQAAHMLNIYQLGVPEGGEAQAQDEHTDLEPRSPTSPAGSGRQSPSSEPPPKSQQLAPITAATPPQLQPQQPSPQLQPQAMQQVDQTLSLNAAQLSPNQTNQQPLQQQQPPQLVSERLQCPATVAEASSASPSAFSEPDEATTPMLALGAASPAASPAASTSSEHEAGVVVASLVGATLQCNLKAEPLKAEDEVLLASSPEPQGDAAWEAQEV